MALRGWRNAQGYRIGSWHGRAKLTEEQVAKARAEHRPGVRGRGILALAKRYGVAMATMRDVLSYATWPHVRPLSDKDSTWPRILGDERMGSDDIQVGLPEHPGSRMRIAL